MKKVVVFLSFFALFWAAYCYSVSTQLENAENSLVRLPIAVFTIYGTPIVVFLISGVLLRVLKVWRALPFGILLMEGVSLLSVFFILNELRVGSEFSMELILVYVLMSCVSLLAGYFLTHFIYKQKKREV